MINTARRLFQSRMTKRKYKHGDFRQTFIDCAGQCVVCFEDDFLEIHEPFGENKNGMGKRLQTRCLMCAACHSKEHATIFDHRFIQPSRLALDINIEIILCGGYDKWIDKFGLIDRIGYYFGNK